MSWSDSHDKIVKRILAKHAASGRLATYQRELSNAMIYLQSKRHSNVSHYGSVLNIESGSLNKKG